VSKPALLCINFCTIFNQSLAGWTGLAGIVHMHAASAPRTSAEMAVPSLAYIELVPESACAGCMFSCSMYVVQQILFRPAHTAPTLHRPVVSLPCSSGLPTSLQWSSGRLRAWCMQQGGQGGLVVLPRHLAAGLCTGVVHMAYAARWLEVAGQHYQRKRGTERVTASHLANPPLS
jgi:hypothetical protein